jgi:hypothetical protein
VTSAVLSAQELAGLGVVHDLFLRGIELHETRPTRAAMFARCTSEAERNPACTSALSCFCSPRMQSKKF